MLERIDVDGFKSLTKFTLDIRPGLNILVGPNGAGKSNIILFFEFLSHLASSSAMQATSLVGGAGAAFTLLPNGTLKSEMTFTIAGSGVFASRYRNSRPKRSFSYVYSATINLSPELSSLAFRKQEIRLYEGNKDEPQLEFAEARPVFAVSWAMNENRAPTTIVTAADEALFSPLHYYRSDQEKKFDIAEFISSGFSEELRDYCIFNSLRRFIEPLEIIHDDLVEGRAFNIDPNAVRMGEDIASQPGINHDGSGLAATLFYAQKSQGRGPRGGFPVRFNPYYDSALPKKLVSMVERYVKLINNNFLRLEVDSNPFENKLRVALVQRASGSNSISEIKVPIALVSDGTAKWLSLVTAILSRTSAFAIEEPENFLHPHMQTEAVELVRKVCTENGRRMFALMTTHSETLLNAAVPLEIIVVSMTGGQTIATRPSNASSIEEEIKATGFGLGYFYLAGALS